MQLKPISNKSAADGSARSPQSSTPMPQRLDARQRYGAGMRWMLLSGAIAVMGVGGWLSYQHVWPAASPPVTVSFIPVKRDTVELTISESGTVALEDEQTLKAPGDVTVERVFVQTGDRVKAGAPLIILRNREAQKQRKDQLVDNQKAMLDLTRKREIVRERLTQLTLAEKRLKESQELLNQGFIAETEVQNDRDKVDDARSRVKDAETEELKAELEVKKGVEALRDLEQLLGDNRLNSPIAGIILHVNVKAGDGAKREADLVTLGDPSHETVNLQLPTLTATQVRINQVAQIQMIGPNSKTFLGRVVSLSPQAVSPQSERSFGGQSQAKVDATVALDRPSHVLIPGSQVSVEIVLQQRRNVLTLPLDAIQTSEAQPFVWLKNAAGRAEKRAVKVGLQSLTTAELLAGVQVGDRVALPSPNMPLTPGVPLQEQTSDPVPSPP